MNGLVADPITGRLVQGFIADPDLPGQYLCNFDECRKPTGHHNYAVCWQHTPDCFRERRAMVEQRDLFDREFLAAIGVGEGNISSSRVTVEIVMQGAVVRKARELNATRNRKPLLGERRVSECGELYLGEIS